MANKNDLLFDKPTLIDGGQSKEAIVVTSPDKQPVNTPTVEDIKKIAKGEAEQAAEAASATEWEKSVKDKIYMDNDGHLVITNGELKITFPKWNDQDGKITILGGNLENKIEIDMNNATIAALPRGTWQNYGYLTLEAESLFDQDGDDVYVSNLMNGQRTYKHSLTFDTDNGTYFYVNIFTSDMLEIDYNNMERVKLADGCSGLYEATAIVPAYLEEIYELEGNIYKARIRLADGTIVDTEVIDIVDVVTEC